MRRQVKPFVTEYRGSARRTKDLHAAVEQGNDLQVPRGRTYAEAEKIFQSDGSDDSYEAALRAADALFDTTSRSPAPARATPHAEVSAPASSPFWKHPDDSEIANSSGEDDASGGDAASSPRRILQAIEPPAEDRFAALEAERAPKRRGRKPGSKNKPKPIVGDDWGAPRQTPRLTTDEILAEPSVIDAAPSLAMPEPDNVADFDRTGDDEALPQPRNRNDKFGWKRAGLRPGERWKRRLPKAAW